MSTIHEEAQQFVEVIKQANVACYNLGSKYRNNGLPFQLANAILAELKLMASNAIVLQGMCDDVRVEVAKHILTENGIQFFDSED